MTLRVIEATVTLVDNIDPDQLDYIIACKLIDIGVPMEPFTGECRQGLLVCIPDALNPLKLKYFWHGEDWRQ